MATRYRLNGFLALQLCSTSDMPVRDVINHTHPFCLLWMMGPHVLKTWTPADVDGLLFALQLSDPHWHGLSSGWTCLNRRDVSRDEPGPGLR